MSIVRVVSAAWSRHHLQRMRRAAAIHNPQIARAMEDVPALLQEFWRESGPREFPGMSVSAKTWAWSLRGLLEYFHLAAKSSAQTILPSRAADSVWHAWLAFDPKGLERFQRRYFSKPLSHVPRENMPDTTSTHTALPRTWALASQYEGLPLTNNAESLFLQVEVESILYIHAPCSSIRTMSSLVTRTLKLRIKDRHAALLQRMATQVNQVWNFCNETSSRSIRERSTWLSGFDLQKYTKGFSKCDGVVIGSTTVQQVCEEYATKRKQFKKAKLRWRVSNSKSSKRSLGWIPFKSGALVYANGQIQFAGHRLSLWDSYGLSNYKLRAGNFNQDVRGRWYLNVVVQIPTVASSGKRSVGMDLGVKTAVTTSDGQKLAGHWYRDQEEALARAQRAKKKDRVRAIHAKIANQRKDALHKFSHAMVSQYGAIFVGNISSQWMLKTSSAKGALDASWSRLKIMLANSSQRATRVRRMRNKRFCAARTFMEYKSQQAGVIFEVVNEAYTTQTCSCCGNIPSSSPKGRAGLRVREWTCSDCGAHHDRDVNAAINILAALRCAKTMPQRGIWPSGHRIHARHEYIAV